MDSLDLFTSVTPAGSAIPVSPAIRAAELRTTLSEASAAYYNHGSSPLTDDQFDAMLREIVHLESVHPALRTPSSPTQQIGTHAAPSAKSKHQHMAQMTSLDNAMSDEDVRAFEARAQRFLTTEQPLAPYAIELKMDGLSLSLTYTNGILHRATTRGDGREGEDVTANLKGLVRQIPYRIDCPVPSQMEVRGEVIMPRVTFERINAALDEEGEEAYTNPRNAAAGLLRTDIANKVTADSLLFFAYHVEVPIDDDPPTDSQFALLNLLEQWGFRSSPKRFLAPSIERAIEFTHEIFAERDRLPFDIDGAVIKVDSLALQHELGVAGKYPRGSIARKEAGAKAVTRLLNIPISIGRTGALNPNAELEPVLCGDVTVSAATLHNEEQVERLGLMIGDWVEIERRGDVIPKVLRVLTDRRDGTQTKWHFPTTCPSCGGPVARPISRISKTRDGAPEVITYTANTYCENTACPAQLVRRIEHLASRRALEIEGLGIKVAEQLADLSIIRDLADLYDRLDLQDLLRLDGFARPRAEKLIAAIQASKQKPFHRVLIALGIRHVGQTASELFARHFRTMESLLAASTEEMESIDGIGPTIARAWREWANRPENIALVERLAAAGLTMSAPEKTTLHTVSDCAFTGKTIVITGTIEGYSRETIQAMLRQSGANVTGSISKSTDYLIAGEKAGSKLLKAQNAGVQVLNWSQALGMFGTI